MKLILILLFVLPAFSRGWGQAIDTPYAINTQAEDEHPPSAAASAAMISVPDGFKVTLFAGDPNVHQPIAFEIDDRGRLWVAECYTYEGGEYDLDKRDRIVIFEDTDRDGVFDRRKVFWDKGERLTGITLGFGGVWVTCAPHLLFLPDRNGDDRPDGAPEVLLEGFSVRARHNMVNGLRWGPDGWLYGRHGITDTSLVGTPSTPHGKRVRMNCSIWRYHPQRRVFEIVTNGTTNPWGLDYDDHGQWFFTNNVINHLWHVVPGAHYMRMFGDDFNPHLYELITPTADHFHWDTLGAAGDTGNKNRKQYDGRHDRHGGGHSHAGGMIYLGGSWPERYRGTMLMCNTHGRRVNRDILSREGNSYVGRHAPDFLLANNEWFRGVELKYGPSGSVYLTDWSDLGECHDRDGVHRSSGRIYKIIYRDDRDRLPAYGGDLAKLDSLQLARLQLDANDWFVRHSRRLLQERASAGDDLSIATEQLLEIFSTNEDATRRLRAMWALYSIGELTDEWLLKRLRDPSEHIRVWAIRFLVDHRKPSGDVVTALSSLAEGETSGLVRLFLASAMQRLNQADRWRVAFPLADVIEDAYDRVQPLMIWYGIEPVVSSFPDDALRMAETTPFPLLRRHVARRLASDVDENPEPVSRLIELATDSKREHAIDYLRGISEALRGRRHVRSLDSWTLALQTLETENNPELRLLCGELAIVFGDGRAMDDLVAIVMDASADPSSRRDALRVVVESRPDGFDKSLLALKSDRVVGGEAIRGLSRYENAQVPKSLLRMFGSAKHDLRPAIIETLASRPSYARALLKAVEIGTVERDDIPAAIASVIASHKSDELTDKLQSVWGSVKTSSEEKRKLIAHYRKILSSIQSTNASPVNGRVHFNKLCASCHKMFGQGKSTGPDLTGANRDNLDYLLDNIIDPSRIVPAELRPSVFLLDDGRVITGTVKRRDEQTLTIQTATRELFVATEDIETSKRLQTSLMPEGLLSQLAEDEVRDLIAYLQSPSQVELTETMEQTGLDR